MTDIIALGLALLSVAFLGYFAGVMHTRASNQWLSGDRFWDMVVDAAFDADRMKSCSLAVHTLPRTILGCTVEITVVATTEHPTSAREDRMGQLDDSPRSMKLTDLMTGDPWDQPKPKKAGLSVVKGGRKD